MSQARYAPGIHAALRILKTRPASIRRVLLDERSTNPRLAEVRDLVASNEVTLELVRRHRLDALTGGTRHQGVVVDLQAQGQYDEGWLRTLVERHLSEDVELTLLYLDQVQDPHNLGACLRSAEAAGVDAVIIPRDRSAGLSPTVRKIASGAAEVLPLVSVPNPAKVFDWLREYGVGLFATSDAAAQSLYEADFSGPCMLIMGGEERGLQPALMRRCDQSLSIPMLGQVESLNVSVATGVCLYEIRRQRLLRKSA